MYTDIETLRREIDRKHAEAVRAIETISAYLKDDNAGPPKTTTPKTPRANPKTDTGGTTVERVLGALTNQPQTVEELEAKTGLDENRIRHVLYSKFVNVKKKKVGKKMGFYSKSSTPQTSAPDRTINGVSAASLVREVLKKHPGGLTTQQIQVEVKAERERIGATTNSITSALFNMKRRGKVAHDTSTGVYRPV